MELGQKWPVNHNMQRTAAISTVKPITTTLKMSKMDKKTTIIKRTKMTTLTKVIKTPIMTTLAFITMIQNDKMEKMVKVPRMTTKDKKATRTMTEMFKMTITASLTKMNYSLAFTICEICDG